ncbi:hypothetical protein IGI04_042185 [Brassica rapa subsp. trilocularis]|uniref:Uncharacterized protein n=1 Tax=Brassica rapa subsp. trilocularis TaxID=1813537 RepID=A0ABQ7KIZ0_BRACM|nr:hypothetical protein IGI04_042185 [Brassica rapa subsp. trilocularis]
MDDQKREDGVSSEGFTQHKARLRKDMWRAASALPKASCCPFPPKKKAASSCVCLSAHTGRQWLSISTHISTLVLGLSTLTLPVICSGDFGPRGLSVQYTQDICGCPPAHAGRPWVSVSTHMTSEAVRVCPSAHTGRPWLSISTQISTLVLGLSTLALPVDCSGDFAHVGCLFSIHRTSDGVRQHTQDVRCCPCVSVCVRQHTQDVSGCPSVTYQHGCPWNQHTSPSRGLFGTSVAVHGCPSAHTRRLWLSVCVRQHTQDVCGCPSVHITARSSLDSARWPFLWTVWVIFGPRGLSVPYTGRLWVSASIHMTSVAVRQYTQDVRGCLCVSVCVCLCPSAHTTSVGVRQHTQDVRVCPSAHTGRLWLSVCVRVFTSAHTGRPWLSISTHISTLVLGLSTLTLPVDCSGDFGPRGLSVQYAQDVRGCLTAHTGRPWLCVCVRVCPSVSVSTHRTSVAVHQYTYQQVVSWTQHAGPSRELFGSFMAHGGCLFSTHRTSVGVRQHTQDVCGCLWLSVSTHRMSVAVLVCPCVSVSTHRTSVGVRQHKQDVPLCPSAHTRRPCLSVCVCLCRSAHTGRPWLSISTHISTLVLGLSTLALPVDCLGDFGPRGLSVQFTQDVRGCPQAHIGRPWLSISTHRTTSVGVRQHTQDVRVCPSAHIGHPWLSVCVRVSPSAHTGRLWLSISTHISTLVLGLSTLALPVDCLGDFGPRGLSVQYTQDVRGCLPAHTGRPWLSVSTHITSVAVRVYPFMSVCVCQQTQDVRGCPSVHISERWSLDSARWPFLGTVWVIFGPRGLSVQYTQDVRGCPPAHTGRPWLSMCVRVCPSVSISTNRTSVAVHQYTYQHVGPWTKHAGPSRGLFGTQRTSVAVHQYTYQHAGPWTQHAGPWTQHAGPSHGLFGASVAVCGQPSSHTGRPWLSECVRVCLCVSVSTHRTSVCDVCGCPSAHIGRPCVTSVAGRVCPSAQKGRPWLPISTHISTLVLGLSMLALPMDSYGDFGPRGLFVQYTQDVRGCPPAHTGHLWLSVADRQHTQDVCGCPCVSVCVCVCPSSHKGRLWLPISTHISTLVLRLSMLTLPVDCSGDFGPRGLSVLYTQDVCGCPPAHTGCPWLSVCVRQHNHDVCGCPSVHISARWTSVGVRQHTQNVRVCPSAHTGRPWLSVCVRVCPSAHTGLPWLSISTQISMLVLGLSTLALPVDCLGDFGPRGLSVQYTQDVRGCLPAHTGRLWLSVRVCVCPCVSVSTHRTSVAVWVIFGPRGLSVQYTLDVCGCPPAHTGRLWLFVAVRQHTQDVSGCPCMSVYVRVCPSAHTGLPWLSISTQISTLVLGRRTLTLPVDCSGDFGPHGLSVQYKQDVHCVRQYTQDVRGCPCVSVSTHMTSVGVRVCPSAHMGRPWLFLCVRVCPSAHTGRLWMSISTHISTLVLGLSTLTLPVDCSGDFGPLGLSVQYTQDVRWCPPAHTRRPWLSVAVRQHTGHPWLSVCVRVSLQHTQDVRGCPSAHTGRPCVSVSTHRTSVAVRVRPCVSVSTHRTSVAVHQYTYQHYTHDVRGCPPEQTGRPWLSVAVGVCPSAHAGRLWLSISTHISTLVLGLSTLALPMDCSGDFGPRGLSVLYTQDVCGCPPAHTRRLWLSVCVRVCLSVSVSTHMTSVAVHQYTYQPVCPWTQHAGPSRGLFG